MIARGAERIVSCLTHWFGTLFGAFLTCLLLATSAAGAAGAEPLQATPLHIAVYDVPPYER